MLSRSAPVLGGLVVDEQVDRQDDHERDVYASHHIPALERLAA